MIRKELTEKQKNHIRRFAGTGGRHDRSMYSLNTIGTRFYVFTIDAPGTPHFKKGICTWQGTFLPYLDEFWKSMYTHVLERDTGNIYPMRTEK
jgi:hypothetical protein